MVFGTYQWWRNPCSQDLLGWKECILQAKMDGKLSQTELSSLKLLSIFDLVSCFPIIKFLVLGSNAKIKAFPNLEMLGKFMLLH